MARLMGFFLAKISEREKYLNYSKSYAQVKSFIFYEKDKYNKFKWKNWRDLEKYRIGIQRGFKYGAKFSQAIKSKKLKVFPSNELKQCLDMTLRNRIDLFIATPFQYSKLEKEYPKFRGKFTYDARTPVNTGK
jgi:ABC-type amino acid transport substrate-binding protein